jgi:putative transposase
MAHDDLVCPPPVSPAIIRHAVWLYVRFTLSYRDVEDLLAERGPDVSYETVRRGY